jgi:hypothetical protein
MTPAQFITELTGSSNLNLSVVVKDTIETKITAKFLGLAFEHNSYVTMKLLITVEPKDVTVNLQGEVVPIDPIVYTKTIRADEKTRIPVIDQNGDPIILEGEPLTIPENVYWKVLAWDNTLPYSFNSLLENTIKVKFNLLPNTNVLQINTTDFNF